ncbi:MAG: hypothetical protein COB67_13135 [SAR324 cluster bacterium]|uniref:histidine kinase n=1 Tax=SAR324 cluster bacterium TaxID=2024889 RepID=A0A2A4SQG6_9DELT|nr:MAG: hypothetical protein COB67_13135 [SAR324 cluster bacterium]
MSQVSDLHQANQHIQKLTAQLDSIKHIGMVLSSTLEETELLLLTIREITQLMKADRCTLYLIDEEANEIYSKVKIGNEIKEIRQTIGAGLSGWTAQQGKLINCTDAYQDSRFDPQTDSKTGYITKTVLTMPIFEPPKELGEKKLIAVVQLLNKAKELPFDSDDEALLEALCFQIAIALHNSRLFNESQEKARESEFLFKIEKSIAKTDHLDNILSELIFEVSRFLYAQAGAIFLVNKTERLKCTVGTGLQEEGVKTISLGLGEGFAGWAWKHEQPLVVSNVVEDPRFNPKMSILLGLKLDSVIVVPLNMRGKVIGVIELFNQQQGKGFRSRDLKFLHLVSHYVTHILEIFEYREQKRKKDHLSTIGKMISTVVHDLRSPVSNIKGMLDLLKGDQLDSEQRDEFSGLIDHQLNSMLTMTSEILDFAKGKSSILPRKIGINDLLRLFKNQVRGMIDEDDQYFKVTNKVGYGEIYADAERMCRVFMNIHKNACESYGEEAPYFELLVEEQEDEYCFTLRDQGPGIPEAIQDTLFESFTTYGKESGTGLGLAIVKKIIDEHRGRIQVETSDQGTAFFIYLKKYSFE